MPDMDMMDKIKKVEGEYFICLSISFWGYREGSREHIMKRLAVNNKVLYVDYSINLLQLFSYAHVRSYFFKRQRHLEKINDNLFVLRPFMQLPFGAYFGFINAINQFFLYLQIKKAVSVLNFKRPILWVYHPLYLPQLKRFNEKIVVYHCIDNYDAEISHKLRREYIKKLEKKLSFLANIVFVPSLFLKKKIAAYTSRVYLLGPGVDREFFARAKISPDAKTKDAVIGFVGTIDRRFNPDIVELLASKHPEWKISLVGPIVAGGSKLAKLKKFNNVEFCGFQKDNLDKYYSRFSVGIIPYYVNEFTDPIFPIKIPEFFSYGTPVVCSSFQTMKEFAKEHALLYVAENAEAFVRIIEKIAYESEPSGLRQERINFASDNRWFKKIDYIKNVISGVLL